MSTRAKFTFRIYSIYNPFIIYNYIDTNDYEMMSFKGFAIPTKKKFQDRMEYPTPKEFDLVEASINPKELISYCSSILISMKKWEEPHILNQISLFFHFLRKNRRLNNLS